MEGEEHLSLQVLLAVILLVLYVIAAPIFEKVHFHYMHESGMVMLMGIAILFLLWISLLLWHLVIKYFSLLYCH